MNSVRADRRSRRKVGGGGGRRDQHTGLRGVTDHGLDNSTRAERRGDQGGRGGRGTGKELHTGLGGIVVHGFDELHGRAELHPPVLLLAVEAVAVEALHVLDGGQEAGGVGLDEHEDQDRHEIVGGRHGPLVGQAQQVHDGLRAAQHALQLVLGRLGDTQSAPASPQSFTLSPYFTPPPFPSTSPPSPPPHHSVFLSLSSLSVFHLKPPPSSTPQSFSLPFPLLPFPFFISNLPPLLHTSTQSSSFSFPFLPSLLDLSTMVFFLFWAFARLV